MHRRRLLAALLILGLPATLSAQEDRPKTVALVSVYGPGDISVSVTNKKISHLPVLQGVEEMITQILNARGFRVLPLAPTAARIASGWNDAYYQALEPAQKQEVDASGQPYKDLFSFRLRRDAMAYGPRTVPVKDYLHSGGDFEQATLAGVLGRDGTPRDSVFRNSLAFRRALGKLVADAGADAYVLVRALGGSMAGKDLPVASVSRSTIHAANTYWTERIDLVIVGANGEQLHKGRATAVPERGIPMMQLLRMNYDPDEAIARLKEASQVALAKIFTDIDKAGPEVAFDPSVLAMPDGGSLVAATDGGPSTAVTEGDVVGTWELVEVNGQPLPFNTPQGSVLIGGAYEIAAGGSFKSVWNHMMTDRGEAKAKDSKLDGTYTINGNVLTTNVKGFMARMVMSLVGNPPFEITAPGIAKTAYQGTTYTWKKK